MVNQDDRSPEGADGQRFYDWLDEVGGDLVVERLANRGGWIASVRRVEVKLGALLESRIGCGATPTEAILDLVPRLRGELVVFDATSRDRRREFYAPRSLRRASFDTAELKVQRERAEAAEAECERLRRMAESALEDEALMRHALHELVDHVEEKLEFAARELDAAGNENAADLIRAALAETEGT